MLIEWGKNAYLLLNPYVSENPRNGNWIEIQKRGKNAYLLNCRLLKSRDGIASKSAVVAQDKQRFSVFTIAKNEQRFSLLQRFLFYFILFIYLFICLMGWNMLVRFMCIWRCSEESQVWVWILIEKYGLGFRVGFFFFFRGSATWSFYKGLHFFFLFFG